MNRKEITKNAVWPRTPEEQDYQYFQIEGRMVLLPIDEDGRPLVNFHPDCEVDCTGFDEAVITDAVVIEPARPRWPWVAIVIGFVIGILLLPFVADIMDAVVDVMVDVLLVAMILLLVVFIIPALALRSYHSRPEPRRDKPTPRRPAERNVTINHFYGNIKQDGNER